MGESMNIEPQSPLVQEPQITPSSIRVPTADDTKVNVVICILQIISVVL